MARSNSAGSFTSRIACLCWLTSPGQSLPLNWGSKYCFSTTRQVLANIFSRSSRESCIVSTFVKWNLASPLADDLKRGPVVRSGLITVFLKNIEFCAIQSGSVIHALGKMAVEPFHERGREAVIGWPQAGHNVLRSGHQERSHQTVNPLFALELADPRVTGERITSSALSESARISLACHRP